MAVHFLPTVREISNMEGPRGLFLAFHLLLLLVDHSASNRLGNDKLYDSEGRIVVRFDKLDMDLLSLIERRARVKPRAKKVSD